MRVSFQFFCEVVSDDSDCPRVGITFYDKYFCGVIVSTKSLMDTMEESSEFLGMGLKKCIEKINFYLN